MAHGDDHDIAIKFSLNKYHAFLNALHADDEFRARIAQDPAAALAEYGITVNVEADRLKKVVSNLGLPKKAAVEEHIKGLGFYWIKEKESLLNKLMDDKFRAEVEKDARAALQKEGIDVDALEIPKTVQLPSKDELKEWLKEKNVTAVKFSATLRRHYAIEWYLLTTGAR